MPHTSTRVPACRYSAFCDGGGEPPAAVELEACACGVRVVGTRIIGTGPFCKGEVVEWLFAQPELAGYVPASHMPPAHSPAPGDYVQPATLRALVQRECTRVRMCGCFLGSSSAVMSFLQNGFQS